MILITTSRRPTRPIRTLCKDLSHTFPKTLRINRGKLSLKNLAEKAMELKAEKLLIINRWKGGPGKIELFELTGGALKPVPPLIYIKGVKLRREFTTMPRGRRIRALAIETSETILEETTKLRETFSTFFGAPYVSSGESLKEFDALMLIKETPQGLIVTFNLVPEMVEIGPRFIISHLIWDLTRP